ncbi:SGNH/GDSL hydrolase family protein [Nocardioides bruguierae]|uniref:SGNH/GDSL hydrolase family protein n=1 Tax=Nocardioides bruguierae TaxID=2945102 RepID=A0A9X2D6E7_9ACTN|nr:SGNH/GDSL hydrolase family protein [Nocardioides bruguierae]MCM0620171.1 SGNH/GDSL hydrolase family protein [Nocardioides bruguierae]
MPTSPLRLPTGPARTRLRLAVLAALVLLVAGVVVLADGVTGGTATGSRPSRCDVYVAGSQARAAAVTGSGADVLVVGDSWSAGLGLDDPSQSWARQLPGTVHVAAFSGSGFGALASPCGPRFSFAARMHDALLTVDEDAPVVVMGGLNDWDLPDAAVAAGFARVVRAVGAVGEHDLVVVGPAPAPSRAVQAQHVDGLLSRLAADAGVTYVSVIDVTGLNYLSDDLHLSAASHRTFGRLVAGRLADAGVALG